MNTASDGPLFSQASDEWRTPPELYAVLNAEFRFTLDPAATDGNHLCDTYFTAVDDGLVQSWQGHTVFVNCPYSQSSAWLRKAQEEVSNRTKPTTVVALVAARTDTRVWHEIVMPYAAEVRLVKGRIRFLHPEGAEAVSAPFPSAIIVFTGQLPTRYTSWQQPKRSRSLTSDPSDSARVRRPRSKKSAPVDAAT